MPPRLRLFYQADTGSQGGAGAPTTPTTPPNGGTDVVTALQNLIQRQGGDAGRVAELLYRENHDLREKNRQLAGQLPAQGTVVLDATQASQWQAYTALGKAEEVKAAIEARAAAEAKLATLERGAVLRQVQDVSGYKASVLAQLPGASDLEFALREIEANGTKTPVVYVKTQAGAETLLTEYAQANWADFLPALTAGTQSSAGTPFVRQVAAQGGQTANPVEAFIEKSNTQREAKPSPLARK